MVEKRENFAIFSMDVAGCARSNGAEGERAFDGRSTVGSIGAGRNALCLYECLAKAEGGTYPNVLRRVGGVDAGGLRGRDRG